MCVGDHNFFIHSSIDIQLSVHILTIVNNAAMNVMMLFVFLLLSFKSCLYVLDNSPLSDMSFANIFS